MENRNSLINKFKLGFGGSWKLGTFSQIPVKMHWTFGILILFVFYTALTNGLKPWQAVGFISYVFILFLCVVLHEYGHALMARKFGVKTKDILLSPIGGVARLESMPDKPIEEFFIAIAGPFVNLVIGVSLGILLYSVTGKMVPDINDFRFDNGAEFLRYIIWMNFALFIFNLIPAFPMDGGRILRSLLAAKIGKLKATKIASVVGRLLAIIFVLIGVFNQQLILSLIGLYIFMMAGQEYDQTKIMAILEKTLVGQIMRSSFTRLHLSDTYQLVIEKYYSHNEQNFLVFDSMGNVSGTIPELFIKDVIKNKDQSKGVNQLMSSKIAFVNYDDPLKIVIETMRSNGISIVGVLNENKLVGVLDRNNIDNHIRLNAD